MDSVKEFVDQYDDSSKSLIDFSWNSKHAAEFSDSNEKFRWRVTSYCLDKPEAASIKLLEHLFLADANWSVEAWCAPHHFADLATLLLMRGGEEVIETFATGFNASFDTFGSCHQISFPSNLALHYSDLAREKAGSTLDNDMQSRLESASELFLKIHKGTAGEGWGYIDPGTPVTNIKLVEKRKNGKLLRWISKWIKRAT